MKHKKKKVSKKINAKFRLNAFKRYHFSHCSLEVFVCCWFFLIKVYSLLLPFTSHFLLIIKQSITIECNKLRNKHIGCSLSRLFAFIIFFCCFIYFQLKITTFNSLKITIKSYNFFFVVYIGNISFFFSQFYNKKETIFSLELIQNTKKKIVSCCF